MRTLFFCIGFLSLAHAQDSELGSESSQVSRFQNADDQEFNHQSALILLMGPGGYQNGQPNPVGIPPSIADLELSYVNPEGYEFGVGLPGLLSGGLRYRTGSHFYGQAGGSLVVSANGVGPGVYTGFGVSLERSNNVTFDVSLKQFLAYNLESNKLTTPYAIRIGMGIQW